MGELRRITERYRLDRRIETSSSDAANAANAANAAGTSGGVFQGTDIRSGEPVAVKLFDGGDADEEREMFEAYTAALTALAHPGLPHVVDAGFTSAGSAYLVTSYLQGTPLAEATGAPPARVLSLLLLVAEALEALAETGWAHGNLYLDNVLVVPEPVGEQVKLLGLGTAVFRPGADFFGLSAAVGYPGDRHDLAALACQLFGADPLAEGSSEVRLPAAVGSGIEDVAGLSQVLSDALAGDPAGRLPSYQELRRLLRQSLPDLGLRTAAVRIPTGTAPGVASPAAIPATGAAPTGHAQRTGGWREVRLGTDSAALAPGGTVAESSLPSETMILERLTDRPAPAAPPVPAAAPTPHATVAERTRILRMDDLTGGDPQLEELLRQRRADAASNDLRPELPTALLTPRPAAASLPVTPAPAPPVPTPPAPMPVLSMPVPPSREETERTPPPPGGTVRISREDFEALREPPPAAAVAAIAAEKARGKAPRLSASAPVAVPVTPPAPEVPSKVPEMPTVPTAVQAPAVPRPLAPTAVAPASAALAATAAIPMTAAMQGKSKPTPAAPAPAAYPAAPPTPTIPAAPATASPAPLSLEATQPAPPALPPRPPSRKRTWLVAGAAGVVLLALLAGVGVFLGLRHPAPAPLKPPPVVAKPVAPRPAPAPVPAPAPPVNPQIVQAEGQIVGGDLAAAKATLDAIPADQKAAFTPEENSRYQQALATLAPVEAKQTADHLAQSLAAGDVKGLKAQLATLTPEQETALAPEIKKDVARARKVLDLDSKLSRADKSKNPQETIRQAGLLLAELPRSSRATQARERAAAEIEADADKKLQDGDFDGATARLGQLKDVWPDRHGLGERLDHIQAEKKVDQALDEKLAAAAKAEQQNKPLDGLAILKGAEPNRRYADRFRQAKERLDALFTKLDSRPPEIAFAKSLKDFKYSKGAVITIPLHITDDFEVKSVEAWARPKDGTYVHLTVRQISGADYELQIQPSVHDNKEVEFYLTATDRSGHEGHLGTAQEPKQIKRKWSLF